MRSSDALRLFALIVAVLEGWLIVTISLHSHPSTYSSTTSSTVSHLNTFTRTTPSQQREKSSVYNTPSSSPPSRSLDTDPAPSKQPSLLDGTAKWASWLQSHVLGESGNARRRCSLPLSLSLSLTLSFFVLAFSSSLSPIHLPSLSLPLSKHSEILFLRHVFIRRQY